MRRCLEASVGVGLLLLFAGAFLLSLGILDGRAGAAWVNPLQKAAAGKYSAGGTLDPRNDLDKVFGEPQAQTVEPAAGAPAGASSSAAISGAAQTLTASVSVQVSYIYAGRKIAAVDGSGLHFMHSDHLGTASVVSSAEADVESASRQLPFGTQIGSLTRETDFTGKKPDAGTGNTYFGARYFSPSEGRFMQADPILRRTVSNYAYGNNNPLTMIDPTGAGPEMALPAPWLIGGIAALGAGMVALAQDQDSQAAGQAMAETFEDVSRKVGDFLFGSGAAVASSPGPSSIEAALVPATAAADVLSYTTKPQAKAHSGSQARATEAAEAATAESAQWVTYVHYTDTKSAKSVANP